MRILILLIIALSLATIGTAQFRTPIDETTVSLVFPENFIEERSQQFEYYSEAITLVGQASFDPTEQAIRLQGTYRSKQELETGINLAFQIYDADKELVFREGGRTPLVSSDSGFVSNFDYTISLPSLGINRKHGMLYFQFNYVMEFQYWADQKYPDIELPALLIKDIDLHDPISVPFSWIPTFAARNANTYSFHFYSVSDHLPNATQYRASIDANYRDTLNHDDNKRYEIAEDQLNQTNFLVARMKFDELGAVDRRLGFVLEGVRWHNRPTETFYTTWVLPQWLYSIVAGGFLCALHFLFSFTLKVTNKWIRRTLFLIHITGSIVFLLEFCSSILSVLLTCYLAVFAVKACSRIEYKCYWVMVFFLSTQELIWQNFDPSPSVRVHGIVISIILSAILAAPLVFVRNRIALAIVGNAVLAISAFIFISTNIYYTFFQDLPTWNILNYASQGLDVTDSISSLLTEQHTLVALSLSLYVLLFNVSVFPISRFSSNPSLTA